MSTFLYDQLRSCHVALDTGTLLDFNSVTRTKITLHYTVHHRFSGNGLGHHKGHFSYSYAMTTNGKLSFYAAVDV